MTYMKNIIYSLVLLGLWTVSCNKDQDQAINSSLQDIQSLSEFNSQISDGVSLVFFHATWCPKCAAQRPAVEGLVGDATLREVFFGQVDYEKVTDVVQTAKVQGFPTLVFYKNGVETARFSGQGHSKEKIKDKLLELMD